MVRKFIPYAIVLGNWEELNASIIKIKSGHSVIDFLVKNSGIIKQNTATVHTD